MNSKNCKIALYLLLIIPGYIGYVFSKFYNQENNVPAIKFSKTVPKPKMHEKDTGYA